MKANLTKRKIDSLAVKNTATVWDTKIPGFGIRVSAKGTKTFVLKYRDGAGRQHFYKIGRYGEYTVDEARDAALTALGERKSTTHPAAKARAERDAITMPALVESFKKHHYPGKAEKTKESYDATFAHLKKHAIWRKKAKDVTTADVHGFFLSIEAPFVANLANAHLGTLFSYAVRAGHVPADRKPLKVEAKNLHKRNVRKRYLTIDEYKALGQALQTLETTTGTSGSIIECLRFVVLTGFRIGEARNLKWADVKFDIGQVFLGDTKTGYSERALNPMALDLLRQLHAKRGEDDEYVFMGRKGRPVRGVYAAWYRARKLAGIEDVRIHDLRHSFASILAQAGYSLPMIGALLGHKSVSSTQIYAHLAADPLVAASTDAATRISQALTR